MAVYHTDLLSHFSNLCRISSISVSWTGSSSEACNTLDLLISAELRPCTKQHPYVNVYLICLDRKINFPCTIHTFFQVLCQSKTRSVLVTDGASDFSWSWLFLVKSNMFESFIGFCLGNILVNCLNTQSWYSIKVARKKKQTWWSSQNVTLIWRVICLLSPPQMGHTFNCRLLTTWRFLFSEMKMDKGT